MAPGPPSASSQDVAVAGNVFGVTVKGKVVVVGVADVWDAVKVRVLSPDSL